MANIEDCPGFETFGADVKAARNAKHLSRRGIGGNHRHRLPVSRKYRERGYDSRSAGYHTAYQSVRTSRGTIL